MMQRASVDKHPAPLDAGERALLHEALALLSRVADA